MSLEEEISKQQKVLEELEAKKKWYREMNLTASLNENLQNLKDLREEINATKAIRQEALQTNESIEQRLDAIITLLSKYVADNEKAVNGINTYLKDWARD